MPVSTSPSKRTSVRLNEALNLCRHGHEVRNLSAQRGLGHWIVWGDYGCSECRQVALDAFPDEPAEATLAGRRLPIRRA